MRITTVIDEKEIINLNGDDISTSSFKEIKISLFVARLIWRSIRKI